MDRPFRTRFKKEIIAEYLPPRGKSNKAVILCQGMPGMPSQRTLMDFLAKNRYWAIFPRYRGTWESEGAFLANSPHQDILDVISELPNKFADLRQQRGRPENIFIIGSSFGGAAAILASPHQAVKKIAALSPVIDWQSQHKKESLPELIRFIKDQFGYAYRFSNKSWEQLIQEGNFYNPRSHAAAIQGKKALLIHAQNDDVVPHKPTEHFAKKTGAELVLYKRGGHFGLSDAMQPFLWKRIHAFFTRP